MVRFSWCRQRAAHECGAGNVCALVVALNGRLVSIGDQREQAVVVEIIVLIRPGVIKGARRGLASGARRDKRTPVENENMKRRPQEVHGPISAVRKATPWRRVAVWAVASVLLAAGVANSAENYIGSERCRACHEFEFQVWERSAHHRADGALTEAQRADPKCNTCHTMAAETGDNATSVGCERCHGPGKYYYPDYVMKDRELARAVWLVDSKPEQCTQCHTEGTPSIRPFSFKEMWAKMDHGKAAHDLWKKGRAREPTATKPATPAKPSK